MLDGRPSKTMLRSAIRIAAHQRLDKAAIFHDPVIAGLVPEASEPECLATLDDPGAPDARLFRTLFAVRSRYSEDRLTQAVARGVRQYVMVGAGLNTFPWRQPDFARGMQIFAADHPASLAWSRQRLADHGLSRPANLTYVPADLEACRLGEQLAACGFSRVTASFLSMLGVTQYLTLDAIDALLDFASSLIEGSEIVFSFVPPDDELDGDDLSAVIHSVARTAALGEPWTSRLRASELIPRLYARGFREVFHLTPALAQERYFAAVKEVPSPPGWEQVMSAVV